MRNYVGYKIIDKGHKAYEILAQDENTFTIRVYGRLGKVSHSDAGYPFLEGEIDGNGKASPKTGSVPGRNSVGSNPSDPPKTGRSGWVSAMADKAYKGQK